MIKKEIILLCSAPADIPHVLSLYHENRKKFNISIIVTNVYNVYKFLVSLALDLSRLDFIAYSKNFSLYNPIVILKEKIRLQLYYNKYFTDLPDVDVYFFSHFYDWITFSFVGKLSITQTVYFIDHYDHILSSNTQQTTIKDKIRLVLFEFITGVKLRWFYSGTIKKLEFLYENFKIKRIVSKDINEDIFEMYSQKVYSDARASILLLESDLSVDERYESYQETIFNIIEVLVNNGFNVCLKPHPRLGYSKILEKHIYMKLPDYIPGEFIDVSDFTAIIGVSTVLLATLARYKKVKVYSVLDLFKIKNKKDKELMRKYLVKMSDNKITFINKFKDLNGI